MPYGFDNTLGIVKNLVPSVSSFTFFSVYLLSI